MLSPRIDSKRTKIRMAESVDVPEILQFFERNRERFAPYRPRYSKNFFHAAHWHKRLKKATEDFHAKRSLSLFIFAANDREVIGNISFSMITSLPLASCTLGYNLDAASEGQGIMREALDASIQYMFDTLNMHRIEANYVPDNERSAALLKRLGFAIEGHSPAYLFLDGEWKDHIRTAKRNPNWKAKK